MPKLILDSGFAIDVDITSKSAKVYWEDPNQLEEHSQLVECIGPGELHQLAEFFEQCVRKKKSTPPPFVD